jgi:hypothetical protein
VSISVAFVERRRQKLARVVAIVAQLLVLRVCSVFYQPVVKIQRQELGGGGGMGRR